MDTQTKHVLTDEMLARFDERAPRGSVSTTIRGFNAADEDWARAAIMTGMKASQLANRSDRERKGRNE
jgi:hypothetical protein